MSDAPPDAGSTALAAAGQQRFLTFRMQQALYALPAEDVAEVIRMPAYVRVPQGPAGLLGVANVRGAVMPLASLRALIGAGGAAAAASERAIVIDSGAQQVALAVDAVERVVGVERAQVETRRAELGAAHGERLTGAFEASDGRVARILDVETLLREAFENVRRAEPRRQAPISAAASTADGPSLDEAMLVTFDVAGQEFGMELAQVEEILPAPTDIAAMPRSETLVLGMAGHRDSLLPLMSLRGLLGLGGADGRRELEKVVVTRVGGALVGLVVDRMRSILRADRALIEPVPQVLSARIGGEAQVSAIFRGEGGRRLVSILAPQRLFRDEVMKRLEASMAAAGRTTSEGEGPVASDEIKIVVFRLGDDEFGLPIESVDEVAEAPERITRVPKTPDFLEGVINLRGEVLPVIDQRRRFDLPPLAEGARRRLIVVRSERHRAGLIVDTVSEIARATQSEIGPAPDLNDDTSRLIAGVLNQQPSGRIILVLNPDELLSRAERSLLDKFGTKAAKALS